ncbi:ATP-binding cassette subfamily B protein [Chitinophaga niastensis]|uniref:ATP-binding cassette subfamily B protein n=1 Tax=Chitinophaga niastensis TaxID=536980 RepID=A0A2P8HP37_CHINA|nr:peptidase domain-containing ABC transporter [Chitinophaga niastensis]PSL47981.1 ATP-binding cassette subfamily B protein [Chitinophaga niastensis]
MKFPFYHQLESIDCGPSCLRMVAAYYKKHISLQELKTYCQATRVGITLQDIVAGATRAGFHSFPVKITMAELLKIPLPAILFWRQEHYVVLYKIHQQRNGKKIFHIADPGYGKIQLGEEIFLKDWQGDEEKGVALILQPGNEFANKKEEVSRLKSSYGEAVTAFGRILNKYRWNFSIACILFALAMVTNWAAPLLFQRMIDQGVMLKNMHIVWLIILSQLILFIGNCIFDSLSSVVLVKLNFNISIGYLSQFLQKLIRLPVSFFDTRLNTDLIQRIDDQERIQSFLTYRLIQFIFAIFNLLAFSAILIYFNRTIFGVFLLCTLTAVIWIVLFLGKRKILDYSRFSLLSENKNNVYELIMGMPEIKINNAQTAKIHQWKHIQLKINKIILQALYLNYYQLIGVNFINKLRDIIITGICAWMVINNQMTIGIMMSISFVIGQLSGPVMQIIECIRSIQDAKLSHERIDEIQKKEDENNASKIIPAVTHYGIKLNNISFKYDGSFNPYIISNLSLFVPKGKITAIVGSSGSGKTTLMKLMLAFYNPQQGDILVDKVKLSDINTDEWRKKCGVVMQDGWIYSGTIANNIAIADENPDMKKLELAAEIACIKDFIHHLPLKYNTKIGKSGIELSGGQKQRILIARAVYKDPELMFFDEATSSLDAKNEKEIMDNLNAFFRNRTVVIIAHRLSTVKHADQIIVLEKGKIIETGDHESLAIQKGFYYELVKNQLELGH